MKRSETQMAWLWDFLFRVTAYGCMGWVILVALLALILWRVW